MNKNMKCLLATILCTVFCQALFCQDTISAFFTKAKFSHPDGIENYIQQFLISKGKDTYDHPGGIHLTFSFNLLKDGELEFDEIYKVTPRKTFGGDIYAALIESSKYWKAATYKGEPVKSIVDIYLYYTYHDSGIRKRGTTRMKIGYQFVANHFYNDGTILLNEKKIMDAVSYFRNAVMLNTYDEQALFNLGVCYLKLGDTAKACASWIKSQRNGSTLGDKAIQKCCSNYNRVDEDIIFENEKDSLPFVYTIVDIMPQFPGGKDSLISFIQKEAKFNFDGMAFVEFIVTKTGSIRDINVLGGFGINNISIPVKKIISNMPNWIPGMHRGRNVDVQMSLTISYDGAFIKHE